MIGLLIIIGFIIYVIYNVIKDACEPTLKGHMDFEKFNKDTLGKGYSKRQINKMINSGKYQIPFDEWWNSDKKM